MNTVLLHSFMERYPGAVVEAAADGTVVASNGRLEQLTGRELRGRPLAEVLEESSRRKWSLLLEPDARAAPSSHWELIFECRDCLELRTFLALWSGTDSEPVLWLLEREPDRGLEALYTEVSGLYTALASSQRELAREHARLGRALRQAETALRLRDDVLAVVSHDLRNPLHTIQMATGVLEMPLDEEVRAVQLRIIQRTTAGMSRLIGDLLDSGAIEAGRFTVERAPTDLAALVAESVLARRSGAAEVGIVIRHHCDERVPLVLGDPDRLNQVLDNLLGNALKFTPAGGVIEIRVSAAMDRVSVSVKDSGPGIRPEDLPHVFERFWHADRRRRGGSGLGLAIARGIVEAHGGTLDVESRLGEGSDFRFTLPAGRAAPER